MIFTFSDLSPVLAGCLLVCFILGFWGSMDLLRGFENMADAVYVRGWDDCLEAISVMVAQSSSIEDAKKRIERLRDLIRQDKFEKIRYELGAFGLF